MFRFLGHDVCGILATRPQMEPASLAQKLGVLTIGPPGKSRTSIFPADIHVPGSNLRKKGRAHTRGHSPCGPHSISGMFTWLLRVSHSVMSDSVTPWTVAYQAPLSMGILQATILEWLALPSSRGSSQVRDQTQVFRIAGEFFTIWATREGQSCINTCNSEHMFKWLSTWNS